MQRKEKEVDHTITMNKLQGGQGVPRGTFVKTFPMMFAENRAGTKTISARNKRKTSHHILITSLF
jgi:hypothetical protein